MACLNGFGTPGAQITGGADTPSVTDTSSSTHTPSIPAITKTSSAADKPSMSDKLSTTNHVSTTIMPLIHRITLDDDEDSPDETPSPTWHRAAHVVLSTNELLCSIIAHLPLKDIIAATGICRAWRDAIAADTTLQQAMFLKPVELSEVLVESRQLLGLGESETINIDKCTVVGRLHPFAERLCGSIEFRAAQSHALPLPRQRWRGSDEKPLEVFGDLHPKGIWRDMFITQPPCIRVHVEVYERRIQDVDGDQDVCRQIVIQPVNEGFDLERGDGVKLGDLYDYVHRYHYDCQFWETLSVRTSIRKYVIETTNLPDRTSCIVRNGEIRLPDSSPDLPDAERDAFGGDFDYASECGSWADEDGDQYMSERYYDRYSTSDDPFEGWIPGGSSYDSEQEGDGELDDEDGHAGDAYDGDDQDDDESRRAPLQIPRVNVYMPSRKYPVGQDPLEEGVDGIEES